MTTTPRPLCQATKLPLPADQWHGYGSHTIEVVEREVRTTPDGTTVVHVLKAGTFCCARCSAAWLIGLAADVARQPDDDGKVAPCVWAHAHEGDQEPF